MKEWPWETMCQSSYMVDNSYTYSALKPQYWDKDYCIVQKVEKSDEIYGSSMSESLTSKTLAN